MRAIAHEIDDATVGLLSAADLCVDIRASINGEEGAVAHGAEALIRTTYARIDAAARRLYSLTGGTLQ